MGVIEVFNTWFPRYLAYPIPSIISITVYDSTLLLWTKPRTAGGPGGVLTTPCDLVVAGWSPWLMALRTLRTLRTPRRRRTLRTSGRLPRWLPSWWSLWQKCPSHDRMLGSCFRQCFTSGCWCWVGFHGGNVGNCWRIIFTDCKVLLLIHGLLSCYLSYYPITKWGDPPSNPEDMAFSEGT